MTVAPERRDTVSTQDLSALLWQERELLELLVFKLDGYVRPHDGHVGHDDGVLHIDRHSSILESLDARWRRYLRRDLHIPHCVGLHFSGVAGTAMPLHGAVESINRQRLLEEHHGLGTRCGWSEERALED